MRLRPRVLNGTWSRYARSRPLEQDLERELWRAAALEQPDRQVQIDVVARRQPSRSAVAVAGALQLFGPPELDLELLCVLENVEFHFAHRVTSGSAVISSLTAPRNTVLSPIRGVDEEIS